jgi:hypothetical protein
MERTAVGMREPTQPLDVVVGELVGDRTNEFRATGDQPLDGLAISFTPAPRAETRVGQRIESPQRAIGCTRC